MTTNNALLAAIRENPGEDTPRLVYADWLEENAGAVACAACDGTRLVQHRPPRGTNSHAMGSVENCPICHGAGRVSDGRAVLAEFIRVQVELARPSDCQTCSGRRWYSIDDAHSDDCYSCSSKLNARERELWPAVRVWFEGDGVNLWCGRWPGSNTATPAVLVSRGLPAVVRCTLAEWMGGEECPHCDRGVQWRSMPPDSRVCESCGGDPERRKPGTGRTPGIGPRLAQRWPITEVQVEKQPMGSGREFLCLMREDRPSVASPGSAALPASVFDLLKGYRKYIRGARAKCYPDEPAARAALSDAAIAWARSQPIEEGRS